MLIFCYIVYNEADFIRKSLDSVLPFADRIVVVEGRIKGYPFESEYSTDGTLDILDEYSDKCNLVRIHAKDLTQQEMRDLYLCGKEGDTYFILDGDEVLETEQNIKEQIKKGIVYWLWSVDAITQKRQTAIRVFPHIPGIRHHPSIGGAGYLVDAMCRPLHYSLTTQELEGARIIHYTNMRSDERKRAKEKYWQSVCGRSK